MASPIFLLFIAWLTPFAGREHDFAVAAATPTPQSTAGVSSTPAAQAEPATAGQSTSSGPGVPPPSSLPVAGGDGLMPLFGAGLALVAAGWLVRLRTA